MPVLELAGYPEGVARKLAALADEFPARDFWWIHAMVSKYCSGPAGTGTGDLSESEADDLRHKILEFRPGDAVIAAWQASKDPAGRFMAELAEMITSGLIEKGEELPGLEVWRERWGLPGDGPVKEAFQRLLAYPALVTVRDGRYFVTWTQAE